MTKSVMMTNKKVRKREHNIYIAIYTNTNDAVYMMLSARVMATRQQLVLLQEGKKFALTKLMMITY